MQYGEASAEASGSGLSGLTLNTYEGGEPWDKGFHLSEKKATVSRVLHSISGGK